MSSFKRDASVGSHSALLHIYSVSWQQTAARPHSFRKIYNFTLSVLLRKTRCPSLSMRAHTICVYSKYILISDGIRFHFFSVASPIRLQFEKYQTISLPRIGHSADCRSLSATKCYIFVAQSKEKKIIFAIAQAFSTICDFLLSRISIPLRSGPGNIEIIPHIFVLITRLRVESVDITCIF